MPSDPAIDVALDPTLSGFGAGIIVSINAGDGIIVSHCVDGGTYAPGRVRWVDTNLADSAAVQAAAILAALAAG
jgi:hypothetical protein